MTDVFIHVPKAAGSTVVYALRRIYGRDLWIRSGRRWRTDLPTAEELAHGSEPALVGGHMSYGLLEQRRIEGRYLALVREPLDRLESAYRHIRATPRDPLHHLARSASFLEFAVGSPGPEFRNGQTFRLSPRVDVSDSVTEQHLDAIKESVEAGSLVLGVSDMMDASLLLFRREFSWPYPLYWSQNRASRRCPGLSHFGDVESATLARANELDAELYRFAKERVARAASSPKFRRQVRLLNAANVAYRAGVTPRMAALSLRARRRRSRRRR